MQKLTNNAKANLNANISNAVTAIVLQGGQGALFPVLGAGDYFYASFINNSNVIEIVKVTARAVDTLTVIRGQEGTAANAYSAGDRVELRLTAAGIGATQQEAAKAIALAGTDVYTGTLSPVPMAYNPNQLYYVVVTNANLTTTPTVNLSALGALTVTRLDGSAVVPGDMAAGMVAILATNPAANGLLLLNPATAVQPAKGTVASAATVNLDTSSALYQQITGNTGITAFTLASGHVRIVEFASNPLITNGASLILPGGGNVQAAPGDTAIFAGEAAGVVRCIAYIPCAGELLVSGGPLGTPSSGSLANCTGAVGTLTAGTQNTAAATIQTNHQYSQAHGLGGVPALVVAYLLNVTADLGYAPGARVALQTMNALNGNTQGVAISSDAANTYISTSLSISIIPLAAGVVAVIDLTKWSIVLVPYKLN